MAVGYSLMLWDDKTTYTNVGVRKQHSDDDDDDDDDF